MVVNRVAASAAQLHDVQEALDNLCRVQIRDAAAASASVSLAGSNHFQSLLVYEVGPELQCVLLLAA